MNKAEEGLSFLACSIKFKNCCTNSNPTIRGFRKWFSPGNSSGEFFVMPTRARAQDFPLFLVYFFCTLIWPIEGKMKVSR